MAKQKDHIESLDTHRTFFYFLSLYGCYDRTQLQQRLNRSKTTLDTEIQLFRFCIDEAIRQVTPGKTQTYGIAYERYAPCDNELVNLFRQKNFTTNQLNYDFLILFALGDTPLTMVALMEEIEAISTLDFFPPNTTLTEDGLRESLQSLEEVGFVVKSKVGRKNGYRLKRAPDFSVADWENLLPPLSFYKNHSKFQVLGYFAQEIIQENLLHQGQDIPPEQGDIFAYKRHFPHNVLEEDLILTFLQGWESHKLVSFLYQPPGEAKQKYLVVPLQIIENPGRNHIFAYDTFSQSPISFPLWQLEQVKKENKDFSPENYTSCLALVEKSWSMTRLSLVKNPLEAPQKLVEIDFFVDHSERMQDGKPLLWHRLQREKRQGRVEVVGEDHYLFTIALLEPIELIPWIRSFGAKARVRESSAHNLNQILHRHRKELAELYGLTPPTT